MRVLIVIDDLRKAGAQRAVVQEIRALHPRHVEFHVAALACVAGSTFASDLARQGVSVDYIPGSGLVDPRRVAALVGIIERTRPDLVHTHLTYANILGSLASAVARRPVVASLHNVDVNQVSSSRAKCRLEGFVLRHLASRIVVVAAGARAETSRNFDVPVDRIAVVPNGIDPLSVALPAQFDRAEKRRQLGIRPGEQVLCSVARLDESKGHRYLLGALAVLQARQTELRIRSLLVGGGPELGRIRELGTTLGLGEQIALLGVRADVAEIVAASDVFVLPSLNEGLSQALLEAMALGTPVVATNVGGTPDAVEPGRTGWCVPPAAPVALADAIQHSLEEPLTAINYAHAARAMVAERFPIAAHVSRLQTLYECVTR